MGAVGVRVVPGVAALDGEHGGVPLPALVKHRPADGRIAGRETRGRFRIRGGDLVPQERGEQRIGVFPVPVSEETDQPRHIDPVPEEVQGRIVVPGFVPVVPEPDEIVLFAVRGVPAVEQEADAGAEGLPVAEGRRSREPLVDVREGQVFPEGEIEVPDGFVVPAAVEGSGLCVHRIAGIPEPRFERVLRLLQKILPVGDPVAEDDGSERGGGNADAPEIVPHRVERVDPRPGKHPVGEEVFDPLAVSLPDDEIPLLLGEQVAEQGEAYGRADAACRGGQRGADIEPVVGVGTVTVLDPALLSGKSQKDPARALEILPVPGITVGEAQQPQIAAPGGRAAFGIRQQPADKGAQSRIGGGLQAGNLLFRKQGVVLHVHFSPFALPAHASGSAVNPAGVTVP